MQVVIVAAGVSFGNEWMAKAKNVVGAEEVANRSYPPL